MADPRHPPAEVGVVAGPDNAVVVSLDEDSTDAEVLGLL